MTWVRLDDQFPRHPKVADVGPLGLALFTAGLCYCAQYLTDGALTRGAARSLVDLHDPDIAPHVTPDSVIARLVNAGLWEETEAGFQVHDYLGYQPARETVLAQREEARERMQRHRSREVPPNSDRSSIPPVPLNPVPEPVEPENPYPEAQNPSPRRARAREEGPRPADPLWDALVDEIGNGPATRPERGKWNAAVGDLRAIGATAAQIHERSVRYRARWPDIDLTPNGLVGNWSVLAEDKPARASPNGTRGARAPDFSGIETVTDAWKRSVGS